MSDGTRTLESGFDSEFWEHFGAIKNPIFFVPAFCFESQIALHIHHVAPCRKVSVCISSYVAAIE